MAMELTANTTILFQGDSITDCGRRREDQERANAGLGGGYPAFLAARLMADFPGKDLRFFNRGISGNRIVDLYARVREDVINLKPDVLSILIGVNDTWHHFNRNTGVSVEKFARVYREMLGEIRAEIPGVKLVLCEPFVLRSGVVQESWVAEMKDRRAAVREICAEFGGIFVGFQGMFDEAVKVAPAEYWAGDGVHPSAAGHELMARVWMAAVVGNVG